VVEVEGVGRSIVGVIPSGREFPEVLDLWVPFRDEAGADVHRRAFEVVVRLADGIAPVSASADLESLMPGLEARRPPGGYQIRPDLQALKSAFVQEPKVPILVMYLLTSMVLLVACFNVATLLLARGSDRAEEIAVRAGLGAGRGRILRQLLAESAVLAFLGALPGLALGALGLRWLMNTVPIQFPGFIDFSLDPLAVVGMSAVVVGAGVVAGFWPALHGSRTNLAGLLRGGGRVEGVRFGSSRGRAVLVGGQISLTLAVLVGAGMMLKGQAKSGSLDLGFQPAGLLGAYLELEEGGVVSASDRAVFLENLEARMARIPGVEGFSVGTRLPIRGQYYTRPFDVGGEPRDDGGFNHTYFNQVQDDYFQLLQTPVVEGRGFQSADGLQGAPQVAVVDRAFADRHWPGESALGRTVRVGRTADGEGEWDVAQVVGVVETARYLPLVRDPGVLFRPYGQDSGSGATIVLRSSGDPLALRVELEQVTQELQPSLPYHFIETAEDMIRARNWAPSLYVAVFNLMGLFGVLMASVGIFGMVTTAVARRNREFGLRLVVGATRADLRRLVLKDGGRIVLSAAGLGLILGFAFAQGLSSLAPGVSAFDPTVYLGALILTLAVSTLAAAVPALRAGRGDLVKVLKSE
jgi:predicted permease